MNKDLPEFLQKLVARYPDVWEQYGQLSKAIGSVEGLDERSQRLVKLGIAIGSGRQGAVHSHTRKCRKAGLSNAEIFHTAPAGNHYHRLVWSCCRARLDRR